MNLVDPHQSESQLMAELADGEKVDSESESISCSLDQDKSSEDIHSVSEYLISD